MDIHVIAPHEIDAAHEAVVASGLGVPRDQFAFCVELEPEGYIAAWEAGRAIGTVGAVCYDGYAFIGAMTVRPEWQGRGLGKALLGRLLAILEERGETLSQLEATDAGYPLYRRFDFNESYSTVIYQHQSGSENGLNCQLARDLVEPLSADHVDEIIDLDRRVNGARRLKLLQGWIARYPGRGFVARGRDNRLAGYAIASSNRIGPWVATDPTAAEALLDAALTLSYQQAPFVALPGPNSAGAGLLLRAGFDAQRSTRRMWRGPQPPAGEPTMLYGLTSMGLG